MVKVSTRVTAYEVSCLPEDHIDHHLWALKVEDRGRGLWAVLHKGYCLGRDGTWDYEPRSSSRTDEWLTEHRFEYDDAIRLAQQAAPHVTVNGLTPADVLARQGRPC